MKKLLLLSLIILFCGCVVIETPVLNDSSKQETIISSNQTVNETINETVQSNITGQFLMAFHACDMSSANCFDPRNHYTYVAESDDGSNWTMVPGYEPHMGSVPDLIRRGNTLYVFNPGQLRCYHYDTMTWDDQVTMTVKQPDGSQEMIVGPSSMPAWRVFLH